MIKSPISLKENIIIKKTIDTSEIINLFNDSFDLDVSKYFKGIPEIYLCKDIETEYHFFSPRIEGDSSFYEFFQNFDWYYMDSKWEFDIASKYFNKESKILEIGCGEGAFLKKIASLGHDITGIDLNKNTVDILQKEGLHVIEGKIESLSEIKKNQYDFVISFQVLEHVYDVEKFIKAAIKVLKTGGKLILSVPNNKSFIKYSFPMALNMPPHHVGLWDKNSLVNLSRIFNLTPEKIFYEPLQEYHFDWYYNVLKKRCISKIGLLGKILFFPFRNRRYYFILKLLNRFIKGHSILMVYKKE